MPAIMQSRRPENIAIRDKISVIKPSWPQYSWEKELAASVWENHPKYAKQEPTQIERSGPVGAVKDYCENSTLHGVKYIAADDVFLFERILWFGCCVAALVGAVLFVLPVFKRYVDYRLITSVESTSTPIWEVPFPGVTICNINRVMKNLAEEKAPNWTKKRFNAKSNKEDFYSALKLLSALGQMKLKANESVSKGVKSLMNSRAQNTDYLMREVIQPVERMALKCIWLGETMNCSELFDIRRTDEGFCWGFNTKPMRTPTTTEVDDWSSAYVDTSNSSSDYVEEPDATQEDVSMDQNLTSKIRRVNGAGPMMGLTIMLNPDSQQYFNPPMSVTGFKVVVHHPSDFPSMSTKSFLVSAGREVFAAVTPTSTYSTDQVKEIPKTKRDCYLEFDKRLKYYTAYSYGNCLLECQIASMRRNCHCVPYLFALLNTTRICNYTGVDCINSNARRFASIEPKTPVVGLNPKVDSMKNCRCKSSCDEITYFTEVTTAKYPNKPTDISLPDNITDINRDELVLLRIFFKDMSFMQYRRDLYYKWTDVISAFGGVVNLFIGFSFISVAEMIYFFLARPLFRQCLRRS